ncbi:DUF6877 family protein [Clostridium tepidum]
MRIKINNVKDILNNSKYIPVEVIQDIDKRISDWLATGGKREDPYIKQQFRYAERVANIIAENLEVEQ